MEIVYQDADLIVCIKPAGVLSTDEPGGLPSLVRETLGDEKADVRTVHRLDRVVSGLMVLARNASAAAALSAQIREGRFQKEYLAVVHGRTEDRGSMRDLLYRDKARKMTFVAEQPGKGVQEALLDYETLDRTGELSLVKILLHTGRTHQIRCQFAHRGLPLAGERKYSMLEDPCPLALWSWRLRFSHPGTEQAMDFTRQPPEQYPWTEMKNLASMKKL